jgi:hypothetical protein
VSLNLLLVSQCDGIPRPRDRSQTTSTSKRRRVDLRAFTAFAETAEPEEVMGVLKEYHAAMGGLILERAGTLERFTGDGLMLVSSQVAAAVEALIEAEPVGAPSLKGLLRSVPTMNGLGLKPVS